MSDNVTQMDDYRQRQAESCRIDVDFDEELRLHVVAGDDDDGETVATITLDYDAGMELHKALTEWCDYLHGDDKDG